MKKTILIFILLFIYLSCFSQARKQTVYTGAFELNNTGALYIRYFNVKLHKTFNTQNDTVNYRWKVKLKSDNLYRIALYIPYVCVRKNTVKIILSEDKKGLQTINSVSNDSNFVYFDFYCTQTKSYYMSIIAQDNRDGYAIGYLGGFAKKPE